MKIAIINETSAADKNADILAALEARGRRLSRPSRRAPAGCPQDPGRGVKGHPPFHGRDRESSARGVWEAAAIESQ